MMAEKRRSFLELLFGEGHGSERQGRVLRYIVHRLGEGARLQNVVEEEYVRRNATRDEVGRIIVNPELIHSSREHLEKAFASGELDPRAPVRR
jgi:hypothetical protein